MKCDNCHQPAETRGAILDNKFGQYCDPCIKKSQRTAGAHAAQWHRERDYEDHRRDLLQPLNARGEPNGEFIRNYPEESKELFTDEQIKKYG